MTIDLDSVKENIHNYLALAIAGEHTFEEVSRLLSSYYLGISEGREIDQLREVLPLFTDANHYIATRSNIEPQKLFIASLENKQQAKEQLDKVMVLNARKL